jgi:hypothetical protein
MNKVRLLRSVLAFALLFAPLACKRKPPIHVQEPDEGSPALASTVHMGDARSESQLVSGFYGVEQGAWRWTARQFTAVLQPPFGAAQKGAQLEFDLTVPPVSIEKLKTISLSAAISGSALPPETYTQAGSFTFKRDVPASLLAGDAVRVDFQLDKAMPPAGADLRELGVVALRVALVPKK